MENPVNLFSKPKYKCHYCHKTYTSQQNRFDHEIKVHPDDKEQSQIFRDKEKAEKREQLERNREASLIITFKCHFCNRTFTSIYHRFQHEQIKHLDHSETSTMFYTKEKATNRLNRLNNYGVYRCPYCQRIFKFHHTLNKHINTDHKIEPIIVDNSNNNLIQLTQQSQQQPHYDSILNPDQAYFLPDPLEVDFKINENNKAVININEIDFLVDGKFGKLSISRKPRINSL